jgi:hypothetical protein
VSFVGTVRNGVVELPRNLALPDGTEVWIETVAPAGDPANAMAGAYALLSQRFASGETDTAARHNEHQP